MHGAVNKSLLGRCQLTCGRGGPEERRRDIRQRQRSAREETSGFLFPLTLPSPTGGEGWTGPRRGDQRAVAA